MSVFGSLTRSPYALPIGVGLGALAVLAYVAATDKSGAPRDPILVEYDTLVSRATHNPQSTDPRLLEAYAAGMESRGPQYRSQVAELRRLATEIRRGGVARPLIAPLTTAPLGPGAHLLASARAVPGFDIAFESAPGGPSRAEVFVRRLSDGVLRTYPGSAYEVFPMGNLPVAPVWIVTLDPQTTRELDDIRSALGTGPLRARRNSRALPTSPHQELLAMARNVPGFDVSFEAVPVKTFLPRRPGDPSRAEIRVRRLSDGASRTYAGLVYATTPMPPGASAWVVVLDPPITPEVDPIRTALGAGPLFARHQEMVGGEGSLPPSETYTTLQATARQAPGFNVAFELLPPPQGTHSPGDPYRAEIFVRRFSDGVLRTFSGIAYEPPPLEGPGPHLPIARAWIVTLDPQVLRNIDPFRVSLGGSGPFFAHRNSRALPPPITSERPQVPADRNAGLMAEARALVANAQNPRATLNVDRMDAVAAELRAILDNTAEGARYQQMADELRREAATARAQRDPLTCVAAPCPYGPVVRPIALGQQAANIDPAICNPNAATLPPRTQARFDQFMRDPATKKADVQILISQLEQCGAFFGHRQNLQRRLGELTAP